MSRIRATVTIHGRVQGVAFRFSTQSRAQSLGLTGWVRNTWAGSVEALFEGEQEKVESMVRWCRHGPPLARVNKADVAYSPATGEFTSFRVTG